MENPVDIALSTIAGLRHDFPDTVPGIVHVDDHPVLLQLLFLTFFGNQLCLEVIILLCVLC